MEPTKYKCCECESIVVIKDDTIVRTCEHVDATIVADMQAVAYGESSVN